MPMKKPYTFQIDFAMPFVGSDSRDHIPTANVLLLSESIETAIEWFNVWKEVAWESDERLRDIFLIGVTASQVQVYMDFNSLKIPTRCLAIPANVNPDDVVVRVDAQGSVSSNSEFFPKRKREYEPKPEPKPRRRRS